MSNVSQIYGTLRDSEPYIILNSTQTEVSGNLAVLQNLDVCGNITFNNTDLSTALSNLVVDLTGGQDASFTNVEITGILDMGTNGTIKAANFNVGSKNVIDGSAGVSCRALEVKNQSNYICLLAQDTQVTISGSLMLNNIDISGKLTQIDASLVDLASGGSGELELLNSTNLITTNLTSGTNFTSSGSDNIILGSHGTIPAGTIGTKNIFIGKNNALNLSNYNNNIILGDNNFKYTTGSNNIAIGINIAENYGSANNTIAIGNGAATLYAQEDSICIGTNAGKHVQNKQKFIAIGSAAAKEGAGNNSIIIGNNTTYGGGNPSNSYDNVIILNATGLGGGGTNDFKPAQSNAFYVKPIRDASSSSGHNLVYDTGSGEITYQPEGDISGTITLSESDSLGNIDVSLASNTLTIDAKNVSYSTNYCVPTDDTSIDNITITNFRKNAQTVIYLQAYSSGTTIRGYTNAPIDDIKKNFADDIVLASGDIAILTITRITTKYFLSASIFK